MADFDFEDNSATLSWVHNAAHSGLLALPEEIHVHIMAYLPVPDMLTHSRACKFLYLTFSSSLLLQLLVSLHAASLSRLPAPSSLTAAQQLALLHEHTEGWSALVPQRRYVVPMPAGIWLGWKADLRGGYYVEADEGHMAVLRLPGSGQGLRSGQVKVVKDIMGCVEEVLVDPSQDLLTYITRTIDRSCLMIGFRTLTGEHHPEALCELEYRQTWHGDFPGVKLFAADLCGPYLAIVVLSFLGRKRLIELVVWNWKEGKVHSTLQPPTDKHYETVTFLSPTTLLTVCLSADVPSLDVYGIEPSLHLLHSFFLPQLSTDIRMSVLLSPNRALPARLPFICPPERRLIALTLRPSRVTSRVVESGMYTLFTLASTLLSPPFPFPALTPTPTIPWSAWGPSHTRLLSHDPTLSINPHGPNFIHSTRAIFAVPSSPHAQPNEGVHFRIVDFNPFALRREPKEGDVWAETVIKGTPFWADGEIRTGLPYREGTTEDVYENPFWVFLDEERIVSVRREELGVEPGGQRRVRNVLEVVVV